MSPPQTDQMKVFLVIIIALVHVYWKSNVPPNDQPCVKISDNNAYDTFAKRHIIRKPENVPTTKKGWKRFLKENGLWDRTYVQSFIYAPEQDIQRICGIAGRLLRDNLCISVEKMMVYDVSNNAASIKRRNGYVIVGCDNVNNIRLPVHYERYRKEKPTNIPCQ